MLKPFTIAAAVFGLASPAQATTEIATTARGLFSNVRVVGQPLTMVGPIAGVSGRTAPGYALNGGVASLVTAVGLGNNNGVAASLNFNLGPIATAASANGTTPANTTSGSASATLDNLAISLTKSSGGPVTSLLDLSATQVRSLTSVGPVGPIVQLSGQSIFTTLALSINGTQVLSLGSNAQVAPNFVAYSGGGLKVTLNEQFSSVFDNTRVLITNAVGISFSNYLLDGRSLSGTITMGQTIAEYQGSAPIPEPAVWAQLIAGFGTLGLALRRRRALQRAAWPRLPRRR